MTKRSRPYLVGNNRDNTINNDNVDDCERSTESSSDDEAIGHFASVAVSGEDICRHAAHGLVGKRKDFRKRYVDPSTSSLPSDGAGKSGTSLLKNDETIKNSINLAEMKIANALIERLDREISIQDINSSKNDTKCKKLVPEVADTQGTGEIMLIKGVRLQPMVRCSTTSTSNPQLCDKESKKPCMRPTIGSRLRAEFTEMDIIANSMSVAIEPDALLKHAEIYRIQAAAHIVPVDPSSEDEGGPARQRRRRKNKILQEEAWARLPS